METRSDLWSLLSNFTPTTCPLCTTLKAVLLCYICQILHAILGTVCIQLKAVVIHKYAHLKGGVAEHSLPSKRAGGFWLAGFGVTCVRWNFQLRSVWRNLTANSDAFNRFADIVWDPVSSLLTVNRLKTRCYFSQFHRQMSCVCLDTAMTVCCRTYDLSKKTVIQEVPGFDKGRTELNSGRNQEGRLGRSPLVKATKVTLFTMILYNSENNIRD